MFVCFKVSCSVSTSCNNALTCSLKDAFSCARFNTLLPVSMVALVRVESVSGSVVVVLAPK